MKLFEIVDEFRLLYDILTDETDPEVIAGTLESLNLELEEKAAGYRIFIGWGGIYNGGGLGKERVYDRHL